MSLMDRQTFDEARVFAEDTAKTFIRQIRGQAAEYRRAMVDTPMTDGEEQHIAKMIAEEVLKAFR